jgi:hypothetical protein
MNGPYQMGLVGKAATFEDAEKFAAALDSLAHRVAPSAPEPSEANGFDDDALDHIAESVSELLEEAKPGRVYHETLTIALRLVAALRAEREAGTKMREALERIAGTGLYTDASRKVFWFDADHKQTTHPAEQARAALAARSPAETE